MIITYHGESFVKVQHGDLMVAINPNGTNQVRVGGKDPFIIDGPGEYEVSNVFIRGVGGPGPDETINTIYILTLDGLRLVHWGRLGDGKLSEAVEAEVGETDILFAPLTNSPAVAYRLALTFQPKIIIPLSESTSLLGQFLKEAGAEKVSPIDKLVLKKKDVSEKEGEIILLNMV
ncbi:MAG: MBL fold metallo-hydrolase [Candidatus Vogelbacteria bacterium]